MKITDTILAKACEESYKNKPNLDTFDYEKFKKKNDEFVFFHNDKEIIISFTGTDDVKDWIDNFFFIKKKTVYGRIHYGFWNTWKTLETEVYNKLNKFNFRDKDVYLTGHSLGGAIASLCSLFLIHKQKIKRVVTFASPRVGNKLWKKKYSENVKCDTIRYVNNQDIVTTLPTLFYWHIGKVVYFNKYGNVVKKRPWNFRFFKRKITGVKDHSIIRYKDKVTLNDL